MKLNKILGILFSMVVVMAIAVYAAPGEADGAAQEGYSSSNVSTTPELTLTAQGGNYTYLNVSANTQTSNWQLFYGTLSSQLLLKDGNNNVAYTWAGSDAVTNGYIFFANSSSIDLSLASAGNAAGDLTAENTLLGLGNSADNMTNTFSSSVHPAIDYGSVGLGADSSFSVTTSNGTSDVWPTAIIKQGTSKAYVGFFNDTHNVAFNGAAANYQVLVPTNASTRTYYVYLALQ